MNKSPDLAITICSHRTISAPTTHSLDLLRLNPTVDYVLHIVTGDALISRSRSQACTKFLESTEIPYLLFIDDDIMFTPDDVKKIYDSLLNGYDCIGGIYPVRGASQLASYGWGGKLDIDGKITEVEYLATGFMGISRRILEKVKTDLNLPLLNKDDWSRCYPFFETGRMMDREHGVPIYISEDWEFCDKLRQIECKVYADTSVQVGHLREQMFTPEDVLKTQTQAKIDEEVYGSLRKQQELILSIDTDMSEFLKQPLAEVQRDMAQAQNKVADLWHSHTGNVESFYKDNQAYLYDLAVSNRYLPYFQNRIGGLVNIRGIKSLDIGCGIGTVAFMMAGQGNESVGWDINQKCISFCEFKKSKYKLGGEFTTTQPDFSQFDLISAIDMLEHIEDLEAFLFDLGHKMKPGAKLYHSDYFPQHDGVWPMHFEEHAKSLSKWLKKGGFTEWDSLWSIKN